MHTIVILIIDDIRPYPYGCFAYQLGLCRGLADDVSWRCHGSLKHDRYRLALLEQSRAIGDWIPSEATVPSFDWK